MIDIKYLREHLDEVKQNAERRNVSVDIDKLLELDGEYLKVLHEVEAVRAERNQIAEQMKSSNDKQALIERGKELKMLLADKDEVLRGLESERNQLLARVPNATHPEVPVGKSDEDNAVVKTVGQVKQLLKPLDHEALVKRHDLADFERAARVTGAKFYYLKNKLALLDWAVLRYAIDFMVREGYTFITTPDLAKEEVLVAKGFLPRGPEKQVYFIEGEDMALIGTSEIPMLGYHMGEVLTAEDLPKKYVAFSHCFRTESGSYGRESYGLYRVHQFNKVEMFAFAKPEQSEAMHAEFLNHEERFWQSLGIPYRVVDCCTGDLGGSDYRRYDIEAWMWGKGEGKGGWGEVTSTSNCIDYQARGLDIKYASKEGERGYVHTLNGTMVATPRALIAIMENWQMEDGRIRVPDVLIPYCGFEYIG